MNSAPATYRVTAVTVSARTAGDALIALGEWMRDNKIDDFTVGTVTFQPYAEETRVDATAYLNT